MVDELISILNNEARVRLRVNDGPIDILSDVGNTKLLPPTITEVDVVKDHSSARIERAASEQARQPGVVDCHIAKGEVFERHFRVGITRYERVKHAAWVFAAAFRAWLVLLLRTDVNGPPGWAVHLDVFVSDITHHASFRWSDHSILIRVVLDVDALEWMIHFAVFKSNVTNARSLTIIVGHH